MSDKLNIPIGWEKGEPLVVSKRAVSYQQAWFVEQRISFNIKKDIPQDAIAAIWFYTWDEFAEFIQWWNKK